MVDAALDWPQCVGSLDRRLPLISAALAGAVRTSVKDCKLEVASPSGSQAPQEGSFSELIREVLTPVNGWVGSADAALRYLRWATTKSHSGCQKLLLELVSFNGLLIGHETALEVQRAHMQSSHVLMCAGHGGTHVVRWEGWRMECWISKLSSEFLEAALARRNGFP